MYCHKANIIFVKNHVQKVIRNKKCLNNKLNYVQNVHILKFYNLMDLTYVKTNAQIINHL